MPSASGCSRPNGPTREGPQRFCMRPSTLRSSSTVYATAVSVISKHHCYLDDRQQKEDREKDVFRASVSS